jgi:hypothetical protein
MTGAAPQKSNDSKHYQLPQICRLRVLLIFCSFKLVINPNRETAVKPADPDSFLVILILNIGLF